MLQVNISNYAPVLDDDDFHFDAELYARAPVFDRATQKELRRRIADIEANGDAVLVDFDPTGQKNV